MEREEGAGDDRRPPADGLLRRRQPCTGQGWGPCPHGRGQCASPPEPLVEKPILGLAVETSAGIPEGLRAWWLRPSRRPLAWLPPPTVDAGGPPWGSVQTFTFLGLLPKSFSQASPNYSCTPEMGPVCGTPRKPRLTKGLH